MSLDGADKLSTVSLDDELLFDEADFLLQKNTKVFYHLIVSLWMCVARHAQTAHITSVQYLCNFSKKKLKDEADLMPADKHQIFLQVNHFRCV